ncbi:MAG: 2-iminoacetate synthase [Clostridiales bacterium]|jgi:2-iminoacetate synthase|nr:[FeFe] hydrogenase H-cluster radical SAM maturase HydG [Eubacteriales bacterium]MDN5313799.1 2-iminoacetate synthase [Clostridiales bacterium]
MNQKQVPFINKSEMIKWLDEARQADHSRINEILDKAEAFAGLTHKEVAVLLTMDSSEHEARLFEVARKIKEHIYGQRIVMFAPLYVSDYCINNCSYCGYQHNHEFKRRILTQDEVRLETEAIIDIGHKRIALEAGEDDEKASLDYILETLKTIYATKSGNGEIRRVNVNIAATTVDNYRRLKGAGIGTYILFQESYDPDVYAKYHKSGPKSDYYWHSMAFDRAQQAGIDDVGGGVLFGLGDPLFEVLGLMLHQEYLEANYGVGFHTISVPRIRPARGSNNKYPYAPNDELFRRLVAIIRLAVPYTGIIISTRESAAMRKELIDCGITQLSADSAVGVGGYRVNKMKKEAAEVQFSRCDERSTSQVIDWMLDEDLIPSYCTACYRKCRTGDRFMQLAKSGQIKYVCQPNALATLAEYLLDYGDKQLQNKGFELIDREIASIEREDIREIARKTQAEIKQGKRDIFL